MMIDVNEFVRESLKIKGTIDVKRSTLENLKLLEKSGVQINLLLARILDGLDFKKMLQEINGNDNESESSSELNENSEQNEESNMNSVQGDK